MRILVTGAAGFVGRHVVEELVSGGHTVLATSRKKQTFSVQHKKIRTVPCDLLKQSAVRALVKKTKPSAIIHLAARPHVAESFKDPAGLFDMNVLPTGYLCKALSELPGRRLFVLASTAMVYAPSPKAIDEKTRPSPKNPYGESKLAAEAMARGFQQKVDVYVLRPFNHTGPGQSEKYVCMGLARRIIETKSGMIPVGNMKARRDFSDVRDVARAYRLIVEKRPKERVFVIGSGKATSIQSILDQLIRISGRKIKTKLDRSLLRKADAPVFIANPARARKQLGWTPKIPLQKTLRDVYRSAADRF